MCVKEFFTLAALDFYKQSNLTGHLCGCLYNNSKDSYV